MLILLDSLTNLLGLGDLGLQGCEPVITLSLVGCLEGILVSTLGEEECKESILSDISDFRLEMVSMSYGLRYEAGVLLPS